MCYVKVIKEDGTNAMMSNRNNESISLDARYYLWYQ